MASPSRPPLLQPTEHYDVSTGKLCAPPCTVDESDFYVRRRGAQGEEEGRGSGKAGVEGGRSGSKGFGWKDKEKEKKGLLPLVVRYLPLDLWFCTSVLKDSTVSLEVMMSSTFLSPFSSLLSTSSPSLLFSSKEAEKLIHIYFFFFFLLRSSLARLLADRRNPIPPALPLGPDPSSALSPRSRSFVRFLAKDPSQVGV